MKYISLFSSAGIGTASLDPNKFECIITNELLSERIQIQINNNICKHKESYICDDITKKDVKDKIYKLNKYHGGADIVFATPPCQGISNLNLKKNDNDNIRNSLIVESLDIIENIKPKLFVLENVSGFLKASCLHCDEWKSISKAITEQLGNKYSISFKKLNLKHVGGHSSRTRTIVVGLRKDISKHYSPWELMPKKVSEKTFHDVLKDMKPLRWGEWDKDDFYHNFRTYDLRMRDWIKDVEPGQTAFDNKEDINKPHKLIDGKIVINKNKTGDKYKRIFPDKTAPCIMTRNDQLASQNTIHPYEDRVLSIRELMELMNIPKSYKLFPLTNEEFFSIEKELQPKKYRKMELNIRRTIGEAVPSFLFKDIAEEFAKQEKKIKLNSRKEINDFIKNNHLQTTEDLKPLINKITRTSLNNLFEMLNNDSKETGLYFTNPDIVTDLINSLDKTGTNIIEPSVGLGSFILPMLRAFPEKKLNFKLFDINKKALEILELLIGETEHSVEFTHGDFLDHNNLNSDLVIGNPPYVGIKKGHKYSINADARNLFELFINKATNISKNVIFVLPKYTLYNNKYSSLRNYMLTKGVYKFWDYRGMLFPNAKIETFAVFLNGKKNKYFYTDDIKYDIKGLTNERSSIWTIRPNQAFLDYSKKLKFLKKINSMRLLGYKQIEEANQFVDVWMSKNLRGIDEFEKTGIDNKYKKFIGMKGLFVPNMTKNIRAEIKPDGVMWNGSLALIDIDEEYYDDAMTTWNSDEFREYINNLRSGAERSINIDKEIIKHFGVIK